jgi:hypothetical protein
MRSSAGAHVVFFSQQRWRVFFLRTRFLHRLTASTQADTSATPLSSLPTSREPPFASSAVCCSWRALKSRTRPARGRNSLSQNGRARAKRQQTRSQLAGMAKMCCVEEEETTATNKKQRFGRFSRPFPCLLSTFRRRALRNPSRRTACGRKPEGKKPTPLFPLTRALLTRGVLLDDVQHARRNGNQ